MAAKWITIIVLLVLALILISSEKESKSPREVQKRSTQPQQVHTSAPFVPYTTDLIPSWAPAEVDSWNMHLQPESGSDEESSQERVEEKKTEEKGPWE